MKKRLIQLILIILILGTVLNCGLFGIGGDDDKDKNRNLLLGLALLNSRRSSGSASRDMFVAFADIPTTITASSNISTSVQANAKVLATTDYRFRNSANTSSVAGVYDLVRVTAKATRDISKSIGDIVKALEPFATTTTLQGSNTASDGWGNQPSKYKYGASTTISGGRKLEVWWNNAPAPYNNNKAIEMNYTGSSAGGNMSGYIFCRYLGKAGDTTLGKAYIKFDYNAASNVRTMAVILQDIGSAPLFGDTAHFFVKEENGVTTMDGGYSVDNYTPNITGVNPANRIYIFNAAGNSERAVVNAAFPLQTDTTSAIYANTTNGNIGQVWTNFLLASTNPNYLASINTVGGTCGAGTINATGLTNGNPTTSSPATNYSVATLKTCMDQNNPATNFKDVYFLTNIKNPAYFNASGSGATLYGVESLDSGDGNKSAFDTLQALLPATTRAVSSTTYQADFSPIAISSLNLFTGANVPSGSTANTFPSINAVWGSGSGTGTSTANAPANSVNGSRDDTAPF